MVEILPQEFAFQHPVSRGGDWPPLIGTPDDEPSLAAVGGGEKEEWTLVTKRADQSITADTTLNLDAELSFPIVANVGYEFDLSLLYRGTSALADLAIAFAVGAGTLVGNYFVLALDTTLNPGMQGSNTLGVGAPANIGTTTGKTFLARVFGGCGCGVATIFGLYWAQVAAVGDTTVEAGSRFRYRRIRG